MKKTNIIAIIIMSSLLLSGCAGIGLNKKTTLMPDEVWIGAETNPNEEDTGEITFGMKWKFDVPKKGGK